MTEKQAEKLLEDIGEAIEGKIEDKIISEELVDIFYDKCFEIIVDDYDEKAIVFLGKNAYSVKPLNVIIDLKRLLSEAGEVLLTVAQPEGTVQVIQLVLLVITKVLKLVVISLGENEINIVSFLHMKELYGGFISEDKLIKNMTEEYSMQEKEISEGIQKLYELKVIDIEEGNVRLNEKVCLSV